MVRSGPAARARRSDGLIGDARTLLRRLGGGRRPIHGADREILADIEQRCHRCQASFACGALLNDGGTLTAPPAFCPNVARFRCLMLEAEHEASRLVG